MALVVISYPNISTEHYSWIQSIRANYDPQYPIINPHFTLVFPCLFENQEVLVKHVKNMVKGIRKINFIISKATTVKDNLNGNTNLFLLPDKGSEDITKLHDGLYSGVLYSALRQDIPFIPHITIGNHANPSELEHIEKIFAEQHILIEGNLEVLDVALYNKGQPVKTIIRINLRK
jgi:2'-5' RNA ligase